MIGSIIIIFVVLVIFIAIHVLALIWLDWIELLLTMGMIDLLILGLILKYLNI
jgi:hypothetical protein